MLKKKIREKTQIKRNVSIEGETIEMKIVRIMNNNEPIADGAPLVYTERKDGVMAEYDPRTDRFDIAIEAMDAVSKSVTAKRMQKAENKDNMDKPVNTSDNKD